MGRRIEILFYAVALLLVGAWLIAGEAWWQTILGWILVLPSGLVLGMELIMPFFEGRSRRSGSTDSEPPRDA